MLPFVHDTTTCDFCGDANSQQYVFDVKTDVTRARSLRVCFQEECKQKFEKSKTLLADTNTYKTLADLVTLVPGFTSVQWKVQRSTGEIDNGWHVSKSWKVQCDLGALVRIRGEPWWRIPLVNDDKVKLVFLHDLRTLNPDVFPDDIWTMIESSLHKETSPSEEFLRTYPQQVFSFEKPSDALLAESRL